MHTNVDELQRQPDASRIGAGEGETLPFPAIPVPAITAMSAGIKQDQYTVDLYRRLKLAELKKQLAELKKQLDLTSDIDVDSMNLAHANPKVNGFKHFLGMKCQSTVFNLTNKVAYVIVTDRAIKTINTTTKYCNIKPAANLGGVEVTIGEVGVANTKQVEKGATPPQMKSIPPGTCHAFNLDSRNYYLTIYTVALDKDDQPMAQFNAVNLKVKGNNDHLIEPNDLEFVNCIFEIPCSYDSISSSIVLGK